jgi:hypothetical protein
MNQNQEHRTNYENLELRKLDLEIQLKEAELKEREAAIKSKKRIDQSLLIAIIGGIIGVLTALLSSWYQHYSDTRLESKKLNSSLILKAIETDNRYKSMETLKFLLRLKLISDENDSLGILLSKISNLNIIPAINQYQFVITVQDSLMTPLSDLDVFCNRIFIGKTDAFGKVQILSSFRSEGGDLFEVKRNNLELTYKTVQRSIDNNVTIVVVPPKD